MTSEPAPVPDHGGRDTTAAFRLVDWVTFSAVSLVWGSSFLLIDIGLDALEPGVITSLRVMLGAATLRLLPGARLRLRPEDRTRMALLSVIWVGVPFTLFPLAEQHINSAVTGLLNGATPMFAALFAIALFGRRTAGPQLLGLVVGFAGVVAISLPSIDQGRAQATGVGLVLAATACYGLAVHLAVPLQTRYGSRPVLARMLALASLWTLPFGLAGLGASEAEAGPLVAVVVLGVVGTGLAYLLMGALLQGVGPTRASFITYLIPVVSLVLGVAVRGDEVARLALAGVVLVVAGAVLAGRAEPTRVGDGS